MNYPILIAVLSLINVAISQDFTPDFCQPEQVRLSVRGDGQTFVVTWTTLSPTTSSVVGTIVEFGSDPENLENSVHGTEEVFTDGGYEKRKEYIHRVIFPKLTPKKRYYYTVGSTCGWSDIFWFNTYPAPSEKWSPSFAVYGDMGNKNAVSLPALQRDTQSGMYDMILHVGDFAYDMNNENGRRGDQFMRQIEPIAAYVPYMTCPGNHENAYNFSHYKFRFTMPDWNEGAISYDLPMFYSWNTGPVHFISLNTEFYYYLNFGATQLLRQYKWLINDLEEANLPENREKQPWIVLFGHRPMYCSDADKDDCTNHNSRTRTGLPFVKLYGLEDLLMKYNVDLVFWAHEHDFERFWPIYDFNIMNGSLAEPYTNPKAPVHIITGSAGCQEEHDPWLPLPEMTAFRSADYGYSRMVAHNTTHLEVAQVSDDQDGKVIDHIWIIKTNGHEF